MIFGRQLIDTVWGLAVDPSAMKKFAMIFCCKKQPVQVFGGSTLEAQIFHHSKCLIARQESRVYFEFTHCTPKTQMAGHEMRCGLMGDNDFRFSLIVPSIQEQSFSIEGSQ